MHRTKINRVSVGQLSTAGNRPVRFGMFAYLSRFNISASQRHFIWNYIQLFECSRVHYGLVVCVLCRKWCFAQKRHVRTINPFGCRFHSAHHHAHPHIRANHNVGVYLVKLTVTFKHSSAPEASSSLVPPLRTRQLDSELTKRRRFDFMPATLRGSRLKWWWQWQKMIIIISSGLKVKSVLYCHR